MTQSNDDIAKEDDIEDNLNTFSILLILGLVKREILYSPINWIAHHSVHKCLVVSTNEPHEIWYVLVR